MKRIKTQLNPEVLPAEAARLLDGAALYDSSCSTVAQVYYIERDGGLFLKTAAAETLRNEASMTAFFHKLGLSAEVLLYCTEHEKDWLITRCIPGEDCLDTGYLSDPKRLCETTATLLRSLHETSAKDCPVPDRNKTYIANVRQGFDGGHFEPELFAGLWKFSSFDEVRATAEAGIPALKSEVLLHGDYCLPNVILQDWRFSGFIDLGNGGIGDRHIDLLWGIWTLKYNLKTTKWTERFLDAYGRELVEPEKLRAVAAMEIVGE